MKKLLLTLIVSFAFCGSIFAQQYETHWPGFNYGPFSDQGAWCAGIIIDGEFVDMNTEGWNALEIAAYVGDELRGCNMFLSDELVEVFGDPYPIIIGACIYYTNPGEDVTFQMWDHVKGILYTDYTIVDLAGNTYDIHTGEEHWEVYDWWEDGLFMSFTTPDTPEPTGIPFEMNCYTDEEGTDNYYLISSPVGAVNPEDVTNMVSPYPYDLYYFDQEGDDYGKEWINYKGADGNFSLQPGVGYLYANAGNGEDPTVTLTFPTTGTYDGDGVFPLDYVEGADFAGMNLVGNPYNATATVTVTDDPDCQFYVMNAATGEVVSSEVSTVEPMQGIFVKATAPGKQVTFTVGETGDKVSKLSLNLLGNKGLVDRAIVNFGEGSLTKFQINSNSTKLYIPVDGEDYAVVSSAEMGELPVNFEAKRSGSYTLAVSSELSFNYLHLIDNKTGADIDLLATPSYSFEAQTTDYASRFRLVFATGNSEDTFAFYSNGSFVINNEGEATVQVMDVTGRMLSSEAINGSASINVEGAAGVYMVRLVNGENVRVQKIIVK